MKADITTPWPNLDAYRWVGYRCDNCDSTMPVMGFRNGTKLCAGCLETASSNLRRVRERSITK